MMTGLIGWHLQQGLEGADRDGQIPLLAAVGEMSPRALELASQPAHRLLIQHDSTGRGKLRTGNFAALDTTTMQANPKFRGGLGMCRRHWPWFPQIPSPLEPTRGTSRDLRTPQP